VSLCAITGTSGLVGGALVRRFRSAGWETRCLVRPARAAPGEAPFELGKPLPPDLFNGVDALVHCAYDWGARGWQDIESVNVRGSIELCHSALSSGVQRLVFISTLSAYHGCPSLYGRGKLMVEDVVRRSGGVVIRPGLVYGDASRGMFGALYRLSGLPLLPIFDGGRQPLFLIHVDDLASVVEVALRPDLAVAPEPITAAFPQPVTFQELLQFLARARGKRLLCVPVPSRLALTGLRLLEAIGLPLPFKSDSLVSLLDASATVDFSGLDRLDVPMRDWRKEFDFSAI